MSGLAACFGALWSGETETEFRPICGVTEDLHLGVNVLPLLSVSLGCSFHSYRD